MLALTNVSLTFGEKAILKNISFQLEEGAFVALVGPSGIGKTSLIRLMGGLEEPTSGHVLLDGLPPASAPNPIGLATQRDTLMPWRTAAENIRLPLELANLEQDEIAEQVAHLLELVGLDEAKDQYPAQLSGGMAQRIALARALIHQPDLLLLDEPFGALDALTREKMGEELLRLWQSVSVTVFMVTHSIEEAILLADRVLIMNALLEGPATIIETVEIDIPRPRSYALRQDSRFLNYAEHIRQALR
ncbi:MAG: ABC transporter ATP-binding protein [Chloroflexota bacterium]